MYQVPSSHFEQPCNSQNFKHFKRSTYSIKLGHLITIPAAFKITFDFNILISVRIAIKGMSCFWNVTILKIYWRANGKWRWVRMLQAGGKGWKRHFFSSFNDGKLQDICGNNACKRYAKNVSIKQSNNEQKYTRREQQIGRFSLSRRTIWFEF